MIFLLHLSSGWNPIQWKQMRPKQARPLPSRSVPFRSASTYQQMVIRRAQRRAKRSKSY
jgi:hypothetical protein